MTKMVSSCLLLQLMETDKPLRITETRTSNLYVLRGELEGQYRKYFVGITDNRYGDLESTFAKTAVFDGFCGHLVDFPGLH